MKTTCGPLYLHAMMRWTGMDEGLVRAFAAGFINGQAEKVYLGACRAAMFRPPMRHDEMVCDIVRDACLRYGLEWTFLREEVWICRDQIAKLAVLALNDLVLNSPLWHAHRAALYGIPEAEVDLSFHERPGYGEPCDVVEEPPRDPV